MSSQIHTNLDRYHQIYVQKWKCVIVLQKNKLILVGFSKPRISNEVIHIRLNAGSFLLNPTLISCNLWSNFQPVRLVGSYHCWFVKKYYWLVCVREKYCSGWKFTIIYDKPQPNEQAVGLDLKWIKYILLFLCLDLKCKRLPATTNILLFLCLDLKWIKWHTLLWT